MKAGVELQKKMGIKNLIISLDSDGLFFASNEANGFISAKKESIFDVSGAGDAIIACLAFLAPFKHLSLKKKLYICNITAYIIIRQIGKKMISRSSLLSEILDQLPSKKAPSFRLTENIKLRLTKEAQFQDIIFTNGYFDQIKFGQINFLKKFSSLQGIKVLAINSDASLSKHRHQPILKEKERLKLLQLFSFIDYIITFDEMNSENLLLELNPTVFVKGKNYKETDISELKTIKKLGIKLKFI